MSNRTYLKHARRVGVVLAVGFAFVAIPVATQASQVNLATVAPFVVLGGSTVTNTGPSVLNGDLGVAPGTSLVGFELPAVVNGATEDNTAVASQAQSDLTAAYNVAAEQPVAPGDDLTGTNLGNRTLTAGAYDYSSSAQLTGTLTLDAQGNPNAQFVFEIGTTLTTASASSVVLTDGASPCNVFWQVGSSATLGTTTAFQGNLMALESISLNNEASVIGRVLARNGAITLIDNVLDNSLCNTEPASPSEPTSTSESTSSSGGSTSTPPSTSSTASTSGTSASSSSSGGSPVSAGQTKLASLTHGGTAIIRRTPHEACTAGFHATVSGKFIKAVVFRMDGRRIASLSGSPFQVFVRAASGSHSVTARVTFTDATPTKILKLDYRACAAAALHPRRGPSRFTG